MVGIQLCRDPINEVDVLLVRFLRQFLEAIGGVLMFGAVVKLRVFVDLGQRVACLLYTSPSPRD